jgi:diguanylate cyclase (GGDEF)-like protein
LLSRSLKINAAQAKALSNLASLDPLTGLLNRRALRQRLHKNTENLGLINDLRKNQSGFETLVLIDLDHFKKFNDQFGHIKGDAHLQACAKLWMKNSRAQDSIARIGGEEFALVMPNCDSVQASLSVRRMLALMPQGTSFSAGIATRLVDEAFESWYSRADAALYRAKSQGRAQTVIASSGEKMNASSSEKMSVKPVK